jgi:aryl-alcohol dehydrogenase-like predicted oxidoreductase
MQVIILFVDKLNEISRKHGATPHQVALSWVYHHSQNILLIPGTSSERHLHENMKAVSLLLTEDEMKELGEAGM